MSDRIENPMFLHCRECIRMGRASFCEVATNGIEIQVWCQNCDREIGTLILRDQFQREQDELKTLDTGEELND